MFGEGKMEALLLWPSPSGMFSKEVRNQIDR